MTADQLAEATQPRLWLGTVTDVDGTIDRDMPLRGPFRRRGRTTYEGLHWGEVSANRVSDLRPAVVVPQPEDKGEVEALARAMSNAEDGGDLWLTWPEKVRGAYRENARAALAHLAAQRPSAPTGDDVIEAAARRLYEGMEPKAEVAALPWDRLLEHFATKGFYRAAAMDLRAAGLLAVPVAVDEATVARVLGWTAETADTLGGHLTGHALRILADDPAEVVRALAARDEDGGEGA